MNFIVREGKREDCKEIQRLIQELADFEKMPDGPKIGARELERDAFDLEHPLFFPYVVDHPDEPGKLIGYVIYFYAYGTWTGKKIYMEDLYVTESFRRKGVGNALFQKVVERGLATGCTRMDFSVLDWNPAQDFYTARLAVNVTKKDRWQLFRLEQEDMEQLVKSCRK